MPEAKLDAILLQPLVHQPDGRYDFPMGLGYLAAYAEANGDYKVGIIDNEEVLILEGTDTCDPQLDDRSLRDHLRDFLLDNFGQIREARLIGISVASDSVDAGLDFARTIKRNSNTPIVFGGYGATGPSRKKLLASPNVDYVVRGEGEITFLRLLEALDPKHESYQRFEEIEGLSFKKDGRIITNPRRELIKDLDTLPFPKRETITGNFRKDELRILGSRGCYGECDFCSIQWMYPSKLGERFRLRSIENILLEIEQAIGERHTSATINFVDDEFLGGGGQRLIQLVDGIGDLGESAGTYIRLGIGFQTRTNDVVQLKDELEYAMQKDRIRYIQLGVESFSRSMLKRLRKERGTDVDMLEANIDAVNILSRLNQQYGVSAVFYIIDLDKESTLDELFEGIPISIEDRLDRPLWTMLRCEGFGKTRMYFNIEDHHGGYNEMLIEYAILMSVLNDELPAFRRLYVQPQIGENELDIPINQRSYNVIKEYVNTVMGYIRLYQEGQDSSIRTSNGNKIITGFKERIRDLETDI